MSMDLEPAGALTTAGLVAKEIEGDAGKAAHGTHTPSQCANCSARLAGPYCHQCGQTAHVHRSLLHLLEELLHGVLHFDTKSWRTLPLLVGRPGLLTRRYIDGQRARYVSPLALFLFSVFLMFFVFSTVAGSRPDSRMRTAAELEESRKELSQEVEKARAHVAEREAKLAQAKTADAREDASDELDDARDDLQESQTALAALDATAAAGSKATTPNANQTTHPKWQVKLQEKLGKFGQEKSQTHPTLARIALHAAENPDLMLYKMKNAAYKFAFMLVPISLPFLWLMFFWRRNITMYDHTIFTLYGLSFLSLWLALIALMANARVTHGLTAPALLFVPVHLFMQLKETYALNWFSAAWRTFALQVAGGIVLILFMLLVLFISLS